MYIESKAESLQGPARIGCCGAGITWIASPSLLWGQMPQMRWIDILLGLLPILVGLLLFIRRLAFKRHILLDSDALTVPTGFLRLRTTRIPYTTIERVSEISFLWRTASLCIATNKGRFEIFSEMLRDVGSYIEVRAFLNSTNAREYEKPITAKRLVTTPSVLMPSSATVISLARWVNRPVP